jgi:hypothetical protein
MFELPLTRGYVALIDDADRDAVIMRSWHAHRNNDGRIYAQTRLFKSETLSRTVVSLHRFLMKPPRDSWVDHRDGNTLNNTRANLRICSPAENNRNRKPIGSTSRFKGVWLYRQSGKLRTAITVGGQRINGGLFETEEEAARRYDELARIHHGEFARLNFPD